jgi:AraC family transcriptional activator FtrA
VACEVFGEPRPDLIDPAYRIRICSVSGNDTVLGNGLIAPRLHALDDLVDADTIVIPALPSFDAVVPTELLEALRTAAARGARIAAICTGAFAAAQAGLLDGVPATTHWMYTDALARRYPAVQVDADIIYAVEDIPGTAGQVCTSAGTAAGLDLCLELVRRDHGAFVATELARRLVVPPHRKGGQAQYVSPPSRYRPTTGIAEALDWAREHLGEPLTVAGIAAHAHTSPRTLNRYFAAELGMSPLAWLTQQRVVHAQGLLETTRLSVSQVAVSCGFGTPDNLRKHFTRHLSVSPSAYRETFAPTTVNNRSAGHI